MEETPERLLVVIPHPDDAEYWCGGTVAKWVSEGASAHYVLCTDGGKGTSDRNANSRDLATQREGEQKDAARVLGVKDVVLLHHADGELEDDAEFRKEIVRQIRLVRPEVVLCPEPYRKNLAWHRDHRIVGQVAIDAVFPAARDHLHFADLWEKEGLEPHKTGTVLFWGTELPDTFIDINSSLETKTQALMAHRSQVGSRSTEEVGEMVKKAAQDSQEASGHTYSEAFRKLTFRT